MLEEGATLEAELALTLEAWGTLKALLGAEGGLELACWLGVKSTLEANLAA